MANGILQPGDVIPEALNWENFEMTLVGGQLIKFSSFDYSFNAEIAINTGKGGEGVSWSAKSYKRDAKASVHIDEMKRIITLATTYGGDILKLPPAPITAKCSVSGQGIWQLIIPAAKISKGSYTFKQGDEKVEVPLEFSIISYPIVTFL